ncbi:MAG: hypothetical protein ACRDG5_10435 [Anaerolineales bacterium]
MPDNLPAVLDEMDGWLADCGTGGMATVTEAEVIKWRAALATALERLDRVEQAGRSVVEAYLLRPPPSALPSPASSRSTARAGQKHMTRLATAMATLERELAAARGGETPSSRVNSPTGSGA